MFLNGQNLIQIRSTKCGSSVCNIKDEVILGHFITITHMYFPEKWVVVIYQFHR